MILRRLSQSLKEQNWTAIWIEFILLVTGVFLGIQVSNWNAERIANHKSQLYTERLRQDLDSEVWRYNALNEYYADVTDNAKKLLAALEGRAELSNEELLIAAYRATQYAELAQYRETFDELVSTGNLELINDSAVRRMAIEIYNSKLYENVKNEGINSPYRVEFRKIIPFNIQSAAASNCGDRPAQRGDFDFDKSNLRYECKLGVPQREIDAAAQIIRTDEALLGLLRLRTANIYTAISTQMLSDEVKVKLKTIPEDKP